jgi:hypothetical protein
MATRRISSTLTHIHMDRLTFEQNVEFIRASRTFDGAKLSRYIRPWRNVPSGSYSIQLFQIVQTCQLLSFGLLFFNIPFLGHWNEKKPVIMFVIYMLSMVLSKFERE